MNSNTSVETLSATHLQLRPGEVTDLAPLFEAAGFDVNDHQTIEGKLHGDTATVTARLELLDGVVREEHVSVTLEPSQDHTEASLDDLLEALLLDLPFASDCELRLERDEAAKTVARVLLEN